MAGPILVATASAVCFNRWSPMPAPKPLQSGHRGPRSNDGCQMRALNEFRLQNAMCRIFGATVGTHHERMLIGECLKFRQSAMSGIQLPL